MVCNIDCSGITRPRQLHRLLAQSLNFPIWYGHNLDALYDCLTELEEETRLVISHWDSQAPWAEGFETVFRAAQQLCPELTVEFE